MTKKVIKIIIFSIISVWILFLLFSMLFPKTRKSLDTIRLLLQKPIIESISNINYLPEQKSSVSIQKYVVKNFKPWDIIFTSEVRSIGSVFIDWKWKHMALYLWSKKELRELFWEILNVWNIIDQFDEEEPLILESNFDGVFVLSLFDMKENESITVVRTELSLEEIKDSIIDSLKHIWKKYDFDFDMLDDSKIYCSELFYSTFLKWWFQPKIDDWLVRATISPNSMFESLFWKNTYNKETKTILYLE